MNSDLVVTLPLPILTCLLSGLVAVLAWRLDLGHRLARVFFAALFGLFAFQALLVGLRFGYGVEDYILVQRVLPFLAGPLMYLGFATLAVPQERLGRIILGHLGAACLLILTCFLIADRVRHLDGLIAVSYIIYAGIMFWQWRKGPDALIHARLDLARPITQWMLFGAGMLLALLILDTAIAISFAMQRAGQAAMLISSGSVLFALLLMAAVFALSRSLSPAPVPTIPSPAEDCEATVSAARLMLEKNQLYLDPDLSMQRLARRLHIPARTLSSAINQSAGMNVSQWVNGFRLAHAAGLLETTKAPVSDIMTQSGFLTRSNFYREFQRVYGQSPASYRRSKA